VTTAKSNKKLAGSAVAPSQEDSLESSNVLDVLIVGGGFSGLLSALRISQQQSSGEQQPRIMLMESKDALGGRMILGNKVLGNMENNVAKQPDAAGETGAPGDSVAVGSFPLALFGDAALSLLAAFHECMTAEERTAIVSFIADGKSKPDRPVTAAPTSAFAKEARGTFVVRKEFTPGPLICVGPSECLTRAAALALGGFLNAAESCRLRDTVFWKELRKPVREELRPFFETFAGDEFEKADAQFLARGLRLALGFGSTGASSDGALSAGSLLSLLDEWRDLLGASVAEFCQAVGEVLTRRGVTIRLQTRIERIEKVFEKTEGRFGYRANALTTGAEISRIRATTVVVTVPLSQSLVVIARDLLTPAESKFVTKIRPRSAVVLELAEPFVAPEYAALGFAKLGEACRFLFPIERVQALQTPDGRLIFYAWLDYEVSLQAPGVREVLARLKRAFRRIFNETELETFARLAGSAALNAAAMPRASALNADAGEKTSGTVRRTLGERLVLIPVAHSVPPEPHDLPEIPVANANTADKTPALVFVGEHFAPAHDALQSVVKSSHYGAECVLRVLLSESNKPRPLPARAVAAARAGATSAVREEGADIAVLEKS
jgi:glycine/D-amino acid oxidase-like deaminating enzyme